MNTIKKKLSQLHSIVKGNCIVLTVKDDTLIVDAGNKSAEEVQSLATTFFRTAYKLSS